MNNEIIRIKIENELLKKQSEAKYFENKVIDTELEFITHLQQMKKNNYLITIMGSLIVFLSAYFCTYEYFDLNKITQIFLLLGDSACALLFGSKFANVINNKMLKELDLNNDVVNIKENELNHKKEKNEILINYINYKLVCNNELLNDLETNNYVINNKNINKTKKLVLKKIV